MKLRLLGTESDCLAVLRSLGTTDVGLLETSAVLRNREHGAHLVRLLADVEVPASGAGGAA